MYHVYEDRKSSVLYVTAKLEYENSSKLHDSFNTENEAMCYIVRYRNRRG